MKKKTKKPLTLNRGTLELKRPMGLSQLRQSLGTSSKVVQVEVRKKRTASPAAPANVMTDAAQAQKLKLLMEAKKQEEEKAKLRAKEDAKRDQERIAEEEKARLNALIAKRSGDDDDDEGDTSSDPQDDEDRVVLLRAQRHDGIHRCIRYLWCGFGRASTRRRRTRRECLDIDKASPTRR